MSFMDRIVIAFGLLAAGIIFYLFSSKKEKNPQSRKRSMSFKAERNSQIPAHNTVEESKMSEYDYLAKILIIGDARSGKSALFLSFAENKFHDTYIPTIGVDFKLRIMEIYNKRVKLQMWDTAGEERFRTITSSYYRGAHGIAIVFNVRDRQSFVNIDQWKHEITRYASESVNVILIGTQIDDTSLRLVTYDEGNAKADSLGISYFETSAKTTAGVQEAFVNISQQIVARLQAHNSPQTQLKPAIYQLLVVGDRCSGKSSLVKRRSQGQFEDTYRKTIGADFSDISVQCDESAVTLRVFDCPGEQETFSFCKPAALLIVFDVSSLDSFLHVDMWLRHFRDLNIPSEKIILVGNKCDIDALSRAVSFESASAKALSTGLTYVETSCKTGAGVMELFTMIAWSLTEGTLVSNPYLLPRIANTFAVESVRYMQTIHGLRLEMDVDSGAPAVYKQGGSSVVYRGSYHDIPVAIKQYTCSFLSLHGFINKDLDQLHIETYIHNSTKRCPTALTMYGSFISNQITYPLIVTELADKYGTLADVLANNAFELSWDWRLTVLQGIASFLSYLHNSNMAHMDLKSENCLVMSIGEDNDTSIKTSLAPHQSEDTCDVIKVFDFSSSLPFGEVGFEEFVNVGHTPSHSPPERLGYLATKTSRVCQGNAFRGTPKVEANYYLVSDKSDIYSFGILMAEVATRGLCYGEAGPQGMDAGASN
jgi:Ras-related protein Rab-1A